jgi:UDP-N-acetylmuramoyl-tripeptide--D-alanyl-D-alanine ligase
MIKLSITNLAKIIDARIITSHDALHNTQYASRVSTDSRSLKPGDCFFAISGEHFDGHNFLKDAFAKGAACAVVSKDPSINNQQSAISNKVILKVPDTVKALGALAAWYRRNCNFKVIAITGSVGKTTTREIIHHILSGRFKTFQSPKNFNNFIGLPLSILAAPPDSRILVLELATNQPGEIEYLTRIAAPDIALITAVAPAHLEGFGDLDTLTEEKLSISQGFNPAGILILNGDCTELVALAQRQHRKFLTFGTNTQCNYPAENLRSDGLSCDFRISGVDIHVPLAGLGNAFNALAAWAVCDQFEIPLPDFADALKTIGPLSMRTEILQIGSLTVIDDCYNANPASMKNAFDVLAALAKDQNRRAVFVCGDMAELGNHTGKFHAGLGHFVAQSNVGLLLVVGNLAPLVAKAASESRSGKLRTYCFALVSDVCGQLHELIKDSDIILVKGSRINKLELVVEKLKQLASAYSRETK